MDLDLENLRLRMRLTQAELAQELKVSQRRISAIENGPDIQLSTLKKYVESLGANLEVNAIMRGERIPILLD